jgi:hypothetical protein
MTESRREFALQCGPAPIALAGLPEAVSFVESIIHEGAAIRPSLHL